MCAEHGGLREDHLPPKKYLGRGTCSEAGPSRGQGSCGRGPGRLERSCHLGDPPAPHKQAQQQGASLDRLPTTSSHLLFSGLWTWLTLCQLKLPPSHPTRYSSQCWGPREERILKRTLPTDSGQRMWPGVSPRPEPDSSQPDNPEGRKQKGLRVGARQGHLPLPVGELGHPTRVPPAFCATWDRPLSYSPASAQSAGHSLPFSPPRNTVRAGEKMRNEGV